MRGDMLRNFGPAPVDFWCLCNDIKRAMEIVNITKQSKDHPPLRLSTELPKIQASMDQAACRLAQGLDPFPEIDGAREADDEQPTD